LSIKSTNLYRLSISYDMRKEVIGNATLYLGDCLEILPTLGKVDAVITDPPYGIGFVHSGKSGSGSTIGIPPGGFGSKFGGEAVTNDDKPFDPAPWIDAAPVVILWGANHYANRLPEGKWLVWDKREVASSFSLADGEVAWMNKSGALRIFRHYWNGMMKASERGVAREHPTQKPIALMAWCLKQAGEPQTVLDPYMGSGTTAIACLQANVQFTGIEIEPKYFDIACERIENAQRQQRMFA
jgi:site-specific DNA-methyltransferase (adenine-specific)